MQACIIVLAVVQSLFCCFSCQSYREDQYGPVPPVDQSELTVTIACSECIYVCNKQLQLLFLPDYDAQDEVEDKMSAESVPMEEVGPSTPEKLV